MAARRLPVALAAAACLILLPGAEPVQSAVHPAGPAATQIAWLLWLMVAAFTAVFLLVMVLAILAIYRRPRGDAAPPLGKTRFIVAGGIVLPVVVLVPILILSLEVSRDLRTPTEGRVVRVVGHMWWWEVHYPEHGIEDANELVIPAGEPVRLELLSADVIHSFWVPRLAGKRDMIPGIVNHFWIQADEPGVYRGVCAEYCGTQHAKMAFLVIALPPAEYQEWVAARTRPPTARTDGKGFEVFRRADCGRCHAIQGTPADGQLGPDLTHIGSRRTLGAATLINNRGNLAGWVTDPQPLKPGVKMPASYLPPADREALVTYLEGLK